MTLEELNRMATGYFKMTNRDKKELLDSIVLEYLTAIEDLDLEPLSQLDLDEHFKGIIELSEEHEMYEMAELFTKTHKRLKSLKQNGL